MHKRLLVTKQRGKRFLRIFEREWNKRFRLSPSATNTKPLNETPFGRENKSPTEPENDQRQCPYVRPIEEVEGHCEWMP